MDITLAQTLQRIKRDQDDRSMTERVQADGWAVGSVEANHQGDDAPDNDR